MTVVDWRRHALSTLKALQDIHIPHLQGIVWDGAQVDPPRALPWYPDNLGIPPLPAPHALARPLPPVAR